MRPCAVLLIHVCLCVYRQAKEQMPPKQLYKGEGQKAIHKEGLKRLQALGIVGHNYTAALLAWG